jgi:hypothetical protein
MDILYGCKLMIVKEIDPSTGLEKTSGKTARFETPQQCGINHQWIEGQRTELRGGDRLLSTVEEPASLIGVELSFSNATLPGEALALLAGGTYQNKKYSAPRLGEEPSPVIVELYVAKYEEGNNDTSGITGYRKWTFWNATGRVPNYTAQDRNFITPQFTIRAKENVKADKPVYEWEDTTSLPSLPSAS